MGDGRRVLIWGAGGHAKVVADLVRACGHELVGHVDLDGVGGVVEPGGATVVVAQEEFLDALDAGEELPGGADAVVVAIGDNGVRRRLHEKLADRYTLPLVHPAATVSPSAELGAGTVVFAGSVINAAARVGEAVIVNTGVIIEHDCVVGDAAHISPNAAICGVSRVGESSWIGSGATVIHGVEVGSGVTIGAGAVVIRDVADGVTAVGNPARVIATE